MDNLLERYLAAVCSYFIGSRKKRVYQSLKSNIESSLVHYNGIEELLTSYGHPKSVALTYGYRPLLQHIYNPKIVSIIERIVFFISGIYLFLSTLYYLQQLNCLPFQATMHVASTLDTSTMATWLLSHPFLVMFGIAFLSVLLMLLLDKYFPVEQNKPLTWSLEKVHKLPHPSQYAHHSIESLLMIIFTIFFFFYTLFFSSDVIIQIQHTSYQMIHLMTFFFQPFILIIFLDYFIDMTKKKNTKKYLKYSSLINLFTLVAIVTFIINSGYLKDYLLPYISVNYSLVNCFIIGALFMITFISLYKLLRNLRSYRCLYRK